MYIKSAASRFPVIVFDLCSFYRLVCSLVVQDLGFYTRSRFLVASFLGMTSNALISRLPSDVSRGLRFSCLLQRGFWFPSYKASRQPYLP